MIGLTLAAALAVSAKHYTCALLAPNNVVVNQEAMTAQLDVEVKDDREFWTLITKGSEDWSAKRQEVRSPGNSDAAEGDRPISLQLKSGLQVEVEWKSTAATEGPLEAALLITSGGDHVVAGLVENDRHYVALGLCHESPQEELP